jgi:hypothetical protein
MATITSQTDGAPALGSDEFAVNRAGSDFKLNHSAIVAGVTGLISAEQVARASADTNLTNTKVALAGDTMTGALFLSGAPTSNLHAATKLYVDGGLSLLLPISGGTMTGNLILNANPTVALGAATKQYADTVAAGRWKNPTSLDCSTNPNYPPSAAGDSYRVTAAGRIGGALGKVVQVDDVIFCHSTDVTGGPENPIGVSYLVLQTNLLQASQTESGYSKIATNTLIEAGTDDTVIISPLGLRKTVTELVPNYDRTITASTSIVVPGSIQSHLYLSTGSASGAVAVSLPQISAMTGNKQITITIKDAGNNASANNITLNRSASDLIDGATSSVISANSGKVTIVNDGGTNWYTI